MKIGQANRVDTMPEMPPCAVKIFQQECGRKQTRGKVVRGTTGIANRRTIVCSRSALGRLLRTICNDGIEVVRLCARRMQHGGYIPGEAESARSIARKTQVFSGDCVFTMKLFIFRALSNSNVQWMSSVHVYPDEFHLQTMLAVAATREYAG